METGDSRRHAKGVRTDTACAAKRFRRYAPEEEKQPRNPSVTANKNLQKIIEAWHKTLDLTGNLDRDIYVGKLYGHCRQSLREMPRLKISPENVQDFLLSLAGMEGRIQDKDEKDRFGTMAGLFASALINSGQQRQKKIVLNVEPLDFRLSWLGYRSRKDIEVFGNPGDCFGCDLNGGKLFCHGDVGTSLGLGMRAGRIGVLGCADIGVGQDMRNGEIIVRGGMKKNHRPSVCGVGREMHGGRIIIGGDSPALYAIGDYMTGGEIHFESGARFDIGIIKQGRIFRNGKLVLER